MSLFPFKTFILLPIFPPLGLALLPPPTPSTPLFTIHASIPYAYVFVRHQFV